MDKERKEYTSPVVSVIDAPCDIVCESGKYGGGNTTGWETTGLSVGNSSSYNLD